MVCSRGRGCRWTNSSKARARKENERTHDISTCETCLVLTVHSTDRDRTHIKNAPPLVSRPITLDTLSIALHAVRARVIPTICVLSCHAPPRAAGAARGGSTLSMWSKPCRVCTRVAAEAQSAGRQGSRAGQGRAERQGRMAGWQGGRAGQGAGGVRVPATRAAGGWATSTRPSSGRSRGPSLS
eukprot:scaffold29844_cov63-Phaeocystis_antarctica.AAC.2